MAPSASATSCGGSAAPPFGTPVEPEVYMMQRPRRRAGAARRPRARGPPGPREPVGRQQLRALRAQQRGGPVPVRGGQHEHPQPRVAHDVAERRVGNIRLSGTPDRTACHRTDSPTRYSGQFGRRNPTRSPARPRCALRYAAEAGAAFGVPGVVDLVVVQPERDVPGWSAALRRRSVAMFIGGPRRPRPRSAHPRRLR
ncbi:hypothetical protein L7F22_063545 [Adiantum nelumboides]|nr:hypothetical protein [Adiantum nelumboides]